MAANNQAVTDQLAVQFSQSALAQAQAAILSIQALVTQAQAAATAAAASAASAAKFSIQIGTVKGGSTPSASITQGSGGSYLLNLTLPTLAGVSVIVTTNGPPSTNLGNDGDYAIDPVGLYFYGPKANGIWPTTPLTSITQSDLDSIVVP